MLRGVNVLADAVKVTHLGRKAVTWFWINLSVPTITKDGVSVAREIELEDKFENMGAQMVKVASKANDAAGDAVPRPATGAVHHYRRPESRCCGHERWT